MALFRSGINKHIAFGSRVASVAVYYVHSHLQYTSASSPVYEQVPQQLNNINCPPSGDSKQNDLSLLNYAKTTLHHIKTQDNIKPDLWHNASAKESISTKSALSLDILTSQTHLALMSLEYDIKWHDRLRTVYSEAMKSRELLGYSTDNHMNISYNYPLGRFHGKSNQFSNVHLKEKRQVNLDQTKILDKDICKNGAVSNIVTFNTIRYSSIDDQAEKKAKKLEDKCDPLLLAIVYQALRDELPAFFQKGHGYNHYHKNVRFINGLTNTTFSGLRTYKCVMTAMRLAAQTCMSDIRMEILKITKDSKECNVKVRWRVSGIPRYTFVLRNQKSSDNCRYVDGFSIFELDTKGLIFCHRLMKLMPSQSPETDNPLWALNTAAMTALLRQQKTFEMLARHRVENIEDTCLPL